MRPHTYGMLGPRTITHPYYTVLTIIVHHYLQIFFTARVGKVEHSRYLPRDIVHRPGQHLIEISSQLRSCQSSFLIIKLCVCFAITAAPSHAPLRDISQALTVVLRAVAVLDLQCES